MPTKCQNHDYFYMEHVIQIINEFKERAQFIIKTAKHQNLVRYTSFGASVLGARVYKWNKH